MEKTLESIFIKQYEDLKKELLQARKRIKELETKPELNKDNEPVVFKTVSKEVCYLNVTNDYGLLCTSHFKDLTSDEIKTILEDDEKVRSYAKLSDDHWSYASGLLVDIDTKAFPYSAKIQGVTVLLNIYSYDKRIEVSSSILCNELKKQRYIDISRKDELYEYGIELFKKELEQAYNIRLKEEQKDE